jgi:hypothetical protein
VTLALHSRDDYPLLLNPSNAISNMLFNIGKQSQVRSKC